VILYDGDMSDTNDEQRREFRVEVHDPRKSNKWETIGEIGEGEL
jgi:hypothetical protein